MQKSVEHIVFVFASRGIGGAERSMLRFMQAVMPQTKCSVIFAGSTNEAMQSELSLLGANYYSADSFGRKLPQIFKQIKPDIVYLFGNIRVIFWAVIARLAGFTAIVGAERTIPMSATKLWGRRLDKHFMSAYICNSAQGAHVLSEACGVGSDKLHIVHNGIDAAKAVAAPKRAESSDALRIVCVANIQPLKGQIVLLEAVALLREKYSGLKAVLVGKDYTDGAFFAEAEARGFSDLVEAAGFVTDVSPFLHEAAVFVLPSVEREGMPTSILEAMLAGLPVVASDVGGVAEIVQQDETGFVVTPNDAAALAERLDVLLDSAELRQQMGSAGRKHIVENYSIERMVAGHLHVFEQVINRQASK